MTINDDFDENGYLQANPDVAAAAMSMWWADRQVGS